MATVSNTNDLISAHKQIDLQNIKLEEYSTKLTNATIKINTHRKEKVSHKSQLANINTQLVFENKEKGKRAAELIVANKKLLFENSEKEKRAQELAIANEKLLYENNEKEKRAQELAIANSELIKAEASQREYVANLEEMMFIVSHKIRNPVANILGISYLLDDHKDCSSPEFKNMLHYIIGSATALNQFTQELSTRIHTNRYDPNNKTTRNWSSKLLRNKALTDKLTP